MNDKAVELILALSEEGKTDDFILKQLIYTPNIRLKKDEAVSLVAKTLKRNEADVSQSLNTLTNPADTDDAPVLETEDDNLFESAIAQTWDWLDSATNDTWAEGMTDYLVNQARVFKQGRLEGGLGDELIGAMDGDADFEALAQAMRNIDSVGQSEAAANFNQAMQAPDLGFWDKVGIFADNIEGGSEVLANSFGRMLGSGTELSGVAGGVGMGGVTAGAYAAVGAGAGSVVPGAGTAAGGIVGGAGGFVKGFMGGVSGMVDAHATIMEILKEELQTKGMHITGQNLEKIFNDEKIVSHMRSQAIARGVTIAVFDSLAAVGSGKAMGLAAKSTSKALTSTAGKSVVGMALLERLMLLRLFLRGLLKCLCLASL
jgi:hypothetical protein